MSGAALAAAASFGLNFYSSLQQTKSQIKQLRQNAVMKYLEGNIFEKNAKQRAIADAYNEDVARKQRDLEMSRLRASTAMSGMTGGTMLEVQMRSQQEADMDDMVMRYNNHTAYVATMYEATKSRMEANQLLLTAKNLKKNKWLNAFISGASGALGTANAGGLLSGSSSKYMDVTNTAASGGNVRFTNASYNG